MGQVRVRPTLLFKKLSKNVETTPYAKILVKKNGLVLWRVDVSQFSVDISLQNLVCHSLFTGQDNF